MPVFEVCFYTKQPIDTKIKLDKEIVIDNPWELREEDIDGDNKA